MDLAFIVTMVSIALALTMTALTWRLMQAERRRSDARVAALATDIHHAPSANVQAELSMNEPPHVPVANLFTAVAPDAAARRPRFPVVIGAGALVVGTVGALVVFATSSARPAAPDVRAARATTAVAASGAPVPLELVALVHEREDDRLTVRGVIRNPSTGREMTNLTAVVLLFNSQGGFLTSGRATVDAPALAPGAEARFVLTVPGAADVGRYRVSFRTEERVIPHVDRRS